MAGLTKDELKQALVSHGVEQNLSAAKKDELVQLYEEFVAPHEENAGEFSSEDESLSPTKISSKRSSRRTSAKVSSTSLRLSPKLSAKGGSPRVSATAALPKSPRVSAKAPTPRVSSKSNGEAAPEAEPEAVNVEELNDSALREQLTEHGVVVGPIVDSTRPLYQKKLASVLAGDNGAEEANDTNGEIEEEEEEVAPTKAASRRVSTRSTRSNIAAAAAEFSADEEEAILEEEPVASEATEDDDSDEQPSVVVKEATPKPASNKSPLQALGQTIRQRFSGPSTTEQKSDRFTPTPRRSIHSYKVTETTRKTVTKDKDGNVTEDVSIDKTTTETDSKVQPAGRMARLLKVLPGILMLLILAALAYYVTAKRK